MRASRPTAGALADYTFVDHVFTIRFYSPCRDTDVADLKRTITLYTRCHMRILRMCLPTHWNEPLVDESTGRSLLPLHSLHCRSVRVREGGRIALQRTPHPMAVVSCRERRERVL